MNRSLVVMAFVMLAMASITAGAWPLILTSHDSESGTDNGKQDELPPTNDSLLFGPSTVEDTNILFNLTNDSDMHHEIKVTFSREEKMPMAFEARGQFYDRTNGQITPFGRALTFSDKGLNVKYHDLSLQAPFSIYEPLENYSNSDELEIPPGSHYLVVAVYDVDLQLSVESYDGQDALSLNILRKGPGMDQSRWAQIEGHWDQVTHEISVNSQVGSIEASLRVDLSESHRYVMISSFGDYNEMRVVDSEGIECSSVGEAYTSPAMFAWSIPSKGEVLVEGTNIAGRGAPIILARVVDLPIDFPQSIDGCWTHNDPPSQ